MCGFVAIIGRPDKDVDPGLLVSATDTLRHRGPDDSGYFTDKNVGLGFRRLAILDLSNQGHQPFADNDSSYIIVFNGEIYNYIELRNELQTIGYSFRSKGDTEVLLYAYKEWGESCVNRLNGMWAFIIFDTKNRTFFGSRDRFGVKPLFYSKQSEYFVFASEIKAINAATGKPGSINWHVAAEYLVGGRLSEPNDRQETMYENVNEVPAGHTFTVDEYGQYQLTRYWNLPTECSDASIDPIEEFSSLLADSVKLRLRSDVPIGVFLSGGLDSTAIVCHMRQLLGEHSTHPLRAFSFMDENFDESKEIMATVRQTQAELNKLTGGDVSTLDRLQEILWLHDEPIHSLNVLISYELYGMAAKHGVKVVLNGQGADETWAGYPSYFLNHWYGLLNSGQISTFNEEISQYCSAHSLSRRETTLRVFRMFWRNQLRRINIYRYLANQSQRKAAVADTWLSDDLKSHYKPKVPQFESLDLQTQLRKSVNCAPLPLYLRVEDRNSMGHSIEARLPFLDYRLVSLGFKLAPDWKLHGQWNKHIVRRSSIGLMPEVVRTRLDKMGFPVPSRKWLSGPMYDAVREIVSSKDCKESGIFNVPEVLEGFEKHRKGHADFSDKILNVVQIQLLSEKLHP